MKAKDVKGTYSRRVDTNKPNPVAKFWRKRAVCTFAGFSPSTLDRRISAKDFPAPIKLGPNTIAWLAEEVQQWAADRVAERDQASA